MQPTGAERRTRIADTTTELIELYIRDNHLGLGDRLPSQARLAELLNVSTRSVREAIRTLESRGALLTEHGRGVFVQQPDIDHFLGVLKSTIVSSYGDDQQLVVDLTRVRRMIESDVASGIARRTPPGFATQYSSLLDRLRAHANCDNREVYDRLDAELHLLLVEASQNQVLISLYRHLFDLFLHCFRRTGQLAGEYETSVRDHEELLGAILTGDEDQARSVIRRHIDATIQNLERLGAPET